MMPVDYVIIGSRVRRRRKELGLTQEQLAEMAAISAPFLGHIERGTRKASIETLVRIGEALDVCLCELIPMRHSGSCEDAYKSLVDDVLRLILARTGRELPD